MRKVAATILLVPFALATGGVWGVAADRITRGKEPWFTTCMLCGLAITIAAMSWLCGCSPPVAAWTLVGTGMAFMALRCLFGKGSAMEMFVGPHLVAVMLLLLWPPLQRALGKHKDPGPNQSAAANSAVAPVLQIVGQWRGVAGRNRWP